MTGSTAARGLARLGATLLALLLGAATALCLVAVHARWWGLLLGLAATVAAVLAAPPTWWARLPYTVGWVAMLGYLLTPRPEGDYLVAQDVSGYSLLVAAVVIAVLTVATLPRRGRPAGERPADRAAADPAAADPAGHTPTPGR